MADVARLRDALDDLLDAGAASLEDEDREAPPRRYKSHGRPAFDGCGHLASWIERIEGRRPNGGGSLPSNTPCAMVSVVTFGLQLARCWGALPSPTEPSPGADDLDFAANEAALDGWALWVGLGSRALDGTLLNSITECQGVAVTDAVPIGPDADGYSWDFEITATVPA